MAITYNCAKGALECALVVFVDFSHSQQKQIEAHWPLLIVI